MLVVLLHPPADGDENQPMGAGLQRSGREARVRRAAEQQLQLRFRGFVQDSPFRWWRRMQRQHLAVLIMSLVCSCGAADEQLQLGEKCLALLREKPAAAEEMLLRVDCRTAQLAHPSELLERIPATGVEA